MDTKIKRMNSKSQITIFIILALILIVLIALIFVAIRPMKVEVIDEKSPQSYIESCTRDAVEKAVEIIGKQGDIDTKGSVMYKGINRTYFCYTNEYYKTCINQKPKLIEHIEEEITSYIKQNVSDCFKQLQNSLKDRYDVEMGEMSLNTILAPKEVNVEINRKFKMTREDKSREFDNFKISLIHPIYNLAEIAMEITNQESHYCNFDTLGYMIIYPDYDITKDETAAEPETHIYIIKDRKSNRELNFAVRSCAMPAGI